jgi:hypothetical protein
MKDFLRVREDGTSRLRVLKDRCPAFVREMRRYQWKVVNGVVSDKPVKKDDHLVDACRYICMYSRLKYQKPKSRAKAASNAYEAFQAVRKRMDRSGKKGEPGVTLA